MLGLKFRLLFFGSVLAITTAGGLAMKFFGPQGSGATQFMETCRSTAIFCLGTMIGLVAGAYCNTLPVDEEEAGQKKPE